MSRRMLVIGMLLVSMLATTSALFAQSSGDSRSMADRVKNIRRGWSGRPNNRAPSAQRDVLPRDVSNALGRQSNALNRQDGYSTRPRAGFGQLGGAPSASREFADKSTSSRPSPSIRQSPKSGPQYDFDPEELRRDLVNSSGQSVSERIAQRNQQSATPTPPVEPSTPTTNEVRAAPALTAPLSPAPVSITPQTVSEPIAAPMQSISAEPIEDVAPLEKPMERISVPVEQEQVKAAGEKAFSDEPVALPLEEAPATDIPITNSEAEDRFTPEDRFRDHDTFVDDDVLVTSEMPLITSQVSGPRHIIIGREATFAIKLSNRGNIAAQQVVAKIHVPAWADVVDTTATSGIIQRDQASREPNTFRWQLHRVAPHGNETLDIKLIPRNSRPLELGVDWTYALESARAIVEVQEPKLRMTVSGPDEVLYDKPQLYRLTLTNPGTRPAEEVTISLMPPGGGEESVSTHVIGDLPPGTSKSVEVELTAREAGQLTVSASAEAIGGLTAEATKSIFCRKPELEVDWRGPEQKYAGTSAIYYFRVRNPGTASAEEVSVNVRIPSGVEFLTASDGQVFDENDQVINWRIGSLRPGDDYYMELKCLVNNAGTNEFTIEATSNSGNLSDTKTASTNVIALADLKLEVSDPKGPIPVGEEAIYEIRVRNRGTNTAEQVNIVALFSDGIDTQAVEGAQYSVADGRVTFRTIEKLSAGREVVLRIRTRATRPGTHVFRAEVLCQDLDIKLAAEETTRFFQDEVYGGATSQDSQQSAGRNDPFGDASSSRY